VFAIIAQSQKKNVFVQKKKRAIATLINNKLKKHGYKK